MEELEARPDDTSRPKPDGESKQEVMGEDLTRTVDVGENMDPKFRGNMVTLLQANSDVIMFLADKMFEIDPTVMVHHVNVDSAVCHVKQKKRKFATEKNKAIKDEVDKLLAADFISKLVIIKSGWPILSW